MVAPLLDPYQRKGYCTLYVDSRPVSSPRTVTRDSVKVQFNTRLRKETMLENLKPCKHVDEDPLNDCEPVNCETYYNGKRSHFDMIQQRCTVVPTCLSLKTRIPKSIYNPVSNKCIKSRVGKNDIDYIKKLVKRESRRSDRINSDINENNELSNNTKIKRLLSQGTKQQNHNEVSSNISKGKRKPKDRVLKIYGEDRKNPILQDKVRNGHTKPEKKEPTDIKGTTALDVTGNNKVLKQGGIKSFPTLTTQGNDNSNLLDQVINIPVRGKDNEMHKANHKTNFIALSGAKQWLKRKLQLLNYIEINKFTAIILPCILIVQCCLIFMMLLCMNKSRKSTRKPIIKKYFNYRQDASVTTPLIGTSNIDTETTECQYMSESSNYIDKKIKCYKALHKDKQNSMKLSMSDDILSKCITRRDWLRLPRSETIPEVRTDEEIKINKETSNYQKKGTEMKVNFQEEYQGNKNKNKNISKKDSMGKCRDKRLVDSSEKEIRCHNYNYENNSNMNSACKSLGIYGQGKNKCNSIEKGAQAYFSNDSIDEFLSERGVLFFGDNISKYSSSSISSDARSTESSQSSRTSKNNIVQNVITLLSKKVKGPSSDPGVKKSAAELDLELLQLSKTSLASSAEMEEAKEMKKVKDSTSSL